VGYGDSKILPVLFKWDIKDFIFNRMATFLLFFPNEMLRAQSMTMPTFPKIKKG
jgi:hypothetical protein